MQSAKHIFINGRFLLQPPTGVNRFAYELCQTLSSAGLEFTIICPKKEIHSDYDITNWNIKYWLSAPSHVWEQLFLPLFFIFFKKPYLLINFTGIGPILILQKIITIHDLAFMYNPNWYTKIYRWLYRILTPWSARTSKAILTVSEFSKTEIQRLLGIKGSCIHVLYNALPTIFLKLKANRYPRPQQNPYILAVSSMDPRKNFQKLVEAFMQLKNSPLDLCIIGAQNTIYSFNQDKGIYKSENRIHWLGRLTDQQLAQYYQHAACFIYPSLYEGFGIPPLEAMLFGCPVLVSNIPVFKEVYADAVRYADPSNSADIALKIENMLSNNNEVEELIKCGYDRVNSFSWKDSGKKLMDLLQDIN